MSEQFHTNPPERYAILDERNARSRYMLDINRPFSVHMSVYDAGAKRLMFNVFDEGYDEEMTRAAKAANRIGRFILAGNMSTATDPEGEPYGPKDLAPEDRLQNARDNMNKYLGSLDVDPANVRVLHPDRDYTTPLRVVNVDTDPAKYDGQEPAKLVGVGDMIYTYDPDIVFGVRPADCPLLVLSAETPKGRIYTMVHFAWQGVAANQIADLARELATLEVDLSTATGYLTPGGHAETFPFQNAPQNPHEKYPDTKGIFKDVTSHLKGEEVKYNFTIDTPSFLYDELLGLGLEADQIFVDTSDTTAPESGYASHSRASRLDDDNGRDFVVVKLHQH